MLCSKDTWATYFALLQTPSSAHALSGWPSSLSSTWYPDFCSLSKPEPTRSDQSYSTATAGTATPPSTFTEMRFSSTSAVSTDIMSTTKEIGGRHAICSAIQIILARTRSVFRLLSLVRDCQFVALSRAATDSLYRSRRMGRQKRLVLFSVQRRQRVVCARFDTEACVSVIGVPWLMCLPMLTGVLHTVSTRI